MKIRKGTSVTHTWQTGVDGELDKGKITEDCEDANKLMVRVKFQGDKRSRWVSCEELIVHRKRLK